MSACRKLALSVVVVALVGTAVATTWSAMSATTSNDGNTFATGTVSLSDNDSNQTALSLAGAQPGTTTTGCIEVSYGGSLSSEVKLFGTTSGALAPYLTLKVTRGTNSATFPNCSFTPDSRNYIGQGAGVVYNGTLSSFPSSYAAGIADPDNATGSPETWTSPEAHAYKLEVTLQNASAAQGQSATASFTWEARNQ